MGLKILNNYHQFQQIYSKFNKNGGENLHIETLAWKLNYEVLNFELESIQNFEKVKTFTNKKRVKENLTIEANDIITESNVHLVVISGNPNNFQKILSISKSFAKFSGYTDEFLLKSKITVVLPKILDQMHEGIIKKYLKRIRNTDTQKVTLSQSWLKRPNGTIIPILIQVIPRVDIDQGLQLVGLVQKIKKIQLFEHSIITNSVFCIMTDGNNKLLHLSQNCVKYLQLPQELHNHDIFITNLIKNIPETIQHNQEFDLILDLTELQQYTNSSSMSISSTPFNIRLIYKEAKYKGDNFLRYYQFVILGYASLSQTNTAYHITQQRLSTNLIVMQFSEEMNQRTQSGSKILVDDSESEQFMIQSMSSTSSGSSNVSTQDAQVSDIKNSFEFTTLPQSLRNYRIKIIISFIILLVTAIVLLAVNIQSKNQFTQDIDALRVEKTMRNAFSSSKLSLLYLYTLNNAQIKYLNQSSYSVPLDTINLDQFLRGHLSDLINSLHLSMVQFSQKQSLWDSNFVYKVSKKPIQAQKITQYGNLQEKVNSTFFKSVTLFVDYADFISNTQKKDIRANDDIFKYNTAEQLRMWVKTLVDPLSTVVQYMYFCVYNGAQALLQSMLDIDADFITLIQSHGDSLINIILIFTICCCCVIALIFALLIPYQYKLDTAQKFSIQFLYLTDKLQIVEFFKKNKDFQQYLLNHNDQGDEYEKENNFEFDDSDQQPRKNSNIKTTFNTFGVINTFNTLNASHINPQNKDESKYHNQSALGDTNQHILTTNNNLLNDTRFITPQFELDEDNIQGELNIRKKYQNRVVGISYEDNKYEEHEDNRIVKFSNNNAKNTIKRQEQFKSKRKHKSENTKKQSDDEDDDEDEESKDINQTRDLRSLGHHQSNLGTKEQQVNEIEMLQFDQIKQKLNSQSKKKKIVITIAFLIMVAIISTFYVVTYILSRKVLSDFQQGFYQYDIFYTRLTCLTESMFFMQKTILFNETMGDDTYNGQQLSQVFDGCSNNEQKYRTIKREANGMFQGLIQDLEKIDSNKFCEFINLKGVAAENCNTDVLGFLNLGLEQMISSILNHIQQKRISFISQPRRLRNEDFLNRMFYLKDTTQYVLIYYKYIEWVMQYIQDVAHNKLSDQMGINFNAIIAIFCVYIVAIVVVSIFTILRLVNSLRLKLLRIRMLLKLMPSMEIYKNKDKLEKLDTKLL